MDFFTSALSALGANFVVAKETVCASAISRVFVLGRVPWPMLIRFGGWTDRAVACGDRES